MIKIEDDLSYEVLDVVESVESDFGFIFTETSDNEGYFTLSSSSRLSVKFDDNTNLIKAEIVLPSDRIDIKDNSYEADSYSDTIESAIAVVDFIRERVPRSEEELD